MRVLITGTDGYIGCLMAPHIAAAGHDVVGLDTGYFRDAQLGAEPFSAFRTITKDVRLVTRDDLDGIDAVIHLAGLSNDALGELSRRVTFDINHRATMRLAALCKTAGISRFVYASSCSIYGKSSADIVDEQSPFDPQTDYAVCKMLDERELSDLADDTFSPTFLRNATAYGASPRMRFDLVVNNLAALAWTTNKIAMVSDGTPWRPIVHVLDICRAFRASLEAPREAIHDRVFNVGRTDENYQIRDIAATIARVFPNCAVSFGKSDPDQRSYRVSFDRVSTELPGFSCEWDLVKGSTQLRDLYEQTGMTEELFRHRPFTRIKQLQHLLSTAQIDSEFYWTAPAGRTRAAELAQHA
ncbi:MAG: SDR family oxidoreductase [Vicinamibacterales bacterium]